MRENEILKINDQLGFHSSLKGLKELYDQGLLGVINGVGYPNPNRSHFRSMEIWHTATDSHKYDKHGWIGRYFDNCCTGSASPHHGVQIGSQLVQAFESRGSGGVCFPNPNTFSWKQGLGSNTTARFKALNALASNTHEHEEVVDYLQHVTADILLSSDAVHKASSYKRRSTSYPSGRFARDLKIVANMIAGGLPTRIYYVSLTGFDTHANQEGLHANLLNQFSSGISAFYKDIAQLQASRNVITICFSEFGRRVSENGSRGTDHGAAGPMFIIGDKVRAGMHGSYPTLSDLYQGDLKHTVDFRAVYSEVLNNWLQVRSEDVLDSQHEHLGFLI